MKHHVMLDIDGTLLQSYAMDEQCFVDAVRETTGLEISKDWRSYPFVVDHFNSIASISKATEESCPIAVALVPDSITSQ
mgnify:CR=1 FL=1